MFGLPGKDTRGMINWIVFGNDKTNYELPAYLENNYGKKGQNNKN